MKKTLLAAIGLTAMIVNPFFACDFGDEDTSFHYTEADMRAAIEGTWRLQLPAHGKIPAREIKLSIREAKGAMEQHAAHHAGLVRTASACSQRSFVRTAGACMDESDMMLDVRVAGTKAGDGWSGRLIVPGMRFHTAWAELHVEDFDVSAQIKPNGDVMSVGALGGELAASSFVRLSR